LFVRKSEGEAPPGGPKDRPSLENVRIKRREILCGMDVTGSGYFPVMDYCELGDRHSG
jgi:hypothetical protein